MATTADLFNFVVQFGPMLGELAARVQQLEERVAELEGTPGGAAAPADQEDGNDFELPGVGKVDLGSMLKEAGGDPKSLFAKLAKWKKPDAAAPTATAANGATAPGAAPPETKVT